MLYSICTNQYFKSAEVNVRRCQQTYVASQHVAVLINCYQSAKAH
jgi:hypothetical protein